MSAVRKREVFNNHVSDLQERKTLKEEQKRLERISVVKGRKHGSHKPMFHLEHNFDFAELELRTLAHFSTQGEKY